MKEKCGQIKNVRTFHSFVFYSYFIYGQSGILCNKKDKMKRFLKD